MHDVLGDITVSRTMDRRIISANDTFRRLTGRLRPEGRTCEEIGLAFRPGPISHCYDVEISTPEGQRIFLWRDVVTRDPANGRLLLQSVARDVTDERLIAQGREEARQKAEYNSAAKSRLLATVSHEVRTPLSGILGMTHLIAETRLTQEQQNYLASIRQSGHALTQLVEDLLDFSTIEVGRFALHPRSESLRKLLESVVEMLAHRAHEKGIEIGATVSSDVPENMSFDPARLRQVLFNVIGNAVKFTQVGGVFIRVSLDAGDLLITVTDSGPGMTAEEQGRVFGEFEQGGTVADKSNGTGLGLAISARIMREFNGALTVASEKGRGSEFAIRFPVDIGSERPERRNTLLALRTASCCWRRQVPRAPPSPRRSPRSAASVILSATARRRGQRCSDWQRAVGGRPTSSSTIACRRNFPTILPIVPKLPPLACARSCSSTRKNAAPIRSTFSMPG